MGCAGSRDKGIERASREIIVSFGYAGHHIHDTVFVVSIPTNFRRRLKVILVFPADSKKIRKPKAWKHTEPLTKAQLMKMREEFWDTAPHYGGRIEIWDALRVAAEADLTLAQAVVDSAGVIVQNPDLTICYDERGAKYELPKYVLSEPTNLIIQDS